MEKAHTEFEKRLAAAEAGKAAIQNELTSVRSQLEETMATTLSRKVKVKELRAHS